MKTTQLYLLILLLNGFTGFSQEIINNPGRTTHQAIHQISTPGMVDLLGIQTMNQGIGNLAFLHQAGHQNMAKISQQADPSPGFSNQSYSYQLGNSNEMTIGQIGSGNVLLSFQLGYLSNSLSQGDWFGFGLENSFGSSGSSNERNTLLAFGERNSLQVLQEGNNNGMMTLQLGSDNLIEVRQKGSNNYLAIIQKGASNAITGYAQESTGGRTLFETITQVGDNLLISATDVSVSKQHGNVLNQSGVHLSLEVNNGFVNTLGGIEVNQTGRDMKVVVDQSYFSFPSH